MSQWKYAAKRAAQLRATTADAAEVQRQQDLERATIASAYIHTLQCGVEDFLHAQWRASFWGESDHWLSVERSFRWAGRENQQRRGIVRGVGFTDGSTGVETHTWESTSPAFKIHMRPTHWGTDNNFFKECSRVGGSVAWVLSRNRKGIRGGILLRSDGFVASVVTEQELRKTVAAAYVAMAVYLQHFGLNVPE